MNRTRLIERVRSLFQTITSEEMTQKIPLEIKYKKFNFHKFPGKLPRLLESLQVTMLPICTTHSLVGS